MLLEEKIIELIQPVIDSLGDELVTVQLVSESGRQILRVFIDKPEGITAEDCALVSRQISALLDVNDPISGRYHLEVSSPGLDRPLMKLQDFARFVNQDAKIRLLKARDGQRHFKGRIIQAVGDRVFLQGENDLIWEFMIEDIEKANLVPKL